jgi:hypothetical protein
LSGDDTSFLVHFAAATSGDALVRAFLSDVMTEAIPFRDWCYLTVAFNTPDARICERMSPAASEAVVIEASAAGVRPDIAEQLSARAQCAGSTNGWDCSWLRPEAAGSSADPSADCRIYEMPHARDWPPYQIAAYYSRFLDALQADVPGDPRRAAART